MELTIKADQWACGDAWVGLVLNPKVSNMAKQLFTWELTVTACHSSIYPSTAPSDKTSLKKAVQFYSGLSSLGQFKPKFASLCGLCLGTSLSCSRLELMPLQPRDPALRWTPMWSAFFNAWLSQTIYCISGKIPHAYYRFLLVLFEMQTQPSCEETACSVEAIPSGFISRVKGEKNNLRVQRFLSAVLKTHYVDSAIQATCSSSTWVYSHIYLHHQAQLWKADWFCLSNEHNRQKVQFN